MTGFAFHPEAEADINDIWEYITTDSSAAADRVTTEIEKALDNLVLLPVRATAARTSLHAPCASFWYANT
jgi:plasmid stabilization system protein ParE